MKSRYLRLIKKQRGFTLIELLAVILILGIIALIAIPTVNSVVEQSRKGATERSAETLVNKIEEKVISSSLSENLLSDGRYNVSDIEEIGIDIKGTTPTAGYFIIDDGKVSSCLFEYDSYTVSCGESKNEIKKNSEITKRYNSYKTGTVNEVSIIYFNPEKNVFCDIEKYNSNSNKNGNTGCLKWYAIENSDETKPTVDAILDHNTTPIAPFKYTYANNKINVSYTDYLNEDTKNWRNGLNSRLINVAEIATITKATSFDPTKPMDEHSYNFETKTIEKPTIYQGTYGWLYDNMYQAKSSYKALNDDNNKYPIPLLGGVNYIWSYWTADVVVENPGQIWGVFRDGALYTIDAARGTGTGIRPVITIQKDVIID